MNKVGPTRLRVKVLTVVAGLVLYGFAAADENQTIRIRLLDGVPADAQGQIEVDIRTWRSDETETLSLQVPVVDDPAPQVVFDSSLGETIDAVVGEALDLPITVSDPGRNRLTVEYLLDGELLSNEQPPAFVVEPIEPRTQVSGVLPFVRAESDGGYGENYFFNAAYFSFSVPYTADVELDSFGFDHEGGYASFSMDESAFIFRDDGDLTADDFITRIDEIDPWGGGGSFGRLNSGEYVMVIVPGQSTSLIEPIVNGEEVQCEGDCPAEDMGFDLTLDVVPLL